MAYLKAAVYDSPNDDLPPVAIIFNTDGSVMTARTVSSIPAGEQLIADTLQAFATEAGLKVQVK